MEEKIIMPIGGNVQGDITSCKIENQVIKIEKNSVLSLKEIKTYASYDVCSKQIIETYSIPAFTGFGIWLWILAIGFIFVIIMLLFGDGDY